MGTLWAHTPFNQYVLKAMAESGLTRDMVARGANIDPIRLARFLNGNYKNIYAVEYLRLCRLLATHLGLPVEWVINKTSDGLLVALHGANEPRYMTPVDPRHAGR